MTDNAHSTGDDVVFFLASTLAAVRDRLLLDGYPDAAELVADLVDIVDDYLVNVRGPRGGRETDANGSGPSVLRRIR